MAAIRAWSAEDRLPPSEASFTFIRAVPYLSIQSSLVLWPDQPASEPLAETRQLQEADVCQYFISFFTCCPPIITDTRRV